MDQGGIATQFLLYLIAVLAPVFSGFVVFLFGYAISYLRSKASQIKNETARRSLEAALAEAEIVGTDAVKATSQKFTEAIKAASSDGKLTQEEIKQAMEMSKNYFLQHISKRSLDILIAARGPVEEWLADFLEAKLYDVKTIKSRVNAFANPSSSARVR